MIAVLYFLHANMQKQTSSFPSMDGNVNSIRQLIYNNEMVNSVVDVKDIEQFRL